LDDCGSGGQVALAPAPTQRRYQLGRGQLGRFDRRGGKGQHCQRVAPHQVVAEGDKRGRVVVT
jgi:hypothetical protein